MRCSRPLGIFISYVFSCLELAKLVQLINVEIDFPFWVEILNYSCTQSRAVNSDVGGLEVERRRRRRWRWRWRWSVIIRELCNEALWCISATNAITIQISIRMSGFSRICQFKATGRPRKIAPRGLLQAREGRREDDQLLNERSMAFWWENALGKRKRFSSIAVKLRNLNEARINLSTKTIYRCTNKHIYGYIDIDICIIDNFVWVDLSLYTTDDIPDNFSQQPSAAMKLVQIEWMNAGRMKWNRFGINRILVKIFHAWFHLHRTNFPHYVMCN